ncbi:translocation/assembly module TamB domain-containing protein [Reichenbachiella sp. MSK19-1]|uniref:translocation/assembly module TamB domain-containing protein n=1 Tax=Reichenbachiella sp. MSK19-1 TaxID=1897631 RepID=UPI000E6B736C|nr:translocation/assembly module TamB domain-containing protein [Reichenbachiella sp. MSK19-1]RJE72976.1 hypothetical protein BGP76_03250 [Reichenbachiella sp. MSK19-1]
MSIGKNYKILKGIGWAISGIFILFVGIVLLIRSAWGQGLIVTKALDFVAQKTDTRVELDRLFITFTGNVYLEGLYVEDQQQDTLLYSDNLEVSVALLPILMDRTIDVDKVSWSGLTARVQRADSTGAFNFDFLIDAFASQDTAQTDPPSEPYQFAIGVITFRDFDLLYDDQYAGMYSTLQLGELRLDVDRMDLETLTFEVDELNIAHTQVVYEQTKATAENGSSSSDDASALPFFRVGDLELEDVTVRYAARPDTMSLDAVIGYLLLEDPVLDLTQQYIQGKKLQLDDSDIAWHSMAMEEQESDTLTQSSASFEWPDWQVQVDDISLERNHLSYTTGSNTPTVGAFNPQAMEYRDLTLKAEDISLQDQQAHLILNQLTFAEASGFTLSELAFELTVDEQSAALTDFVLATAQNKLKADIHAEYASIDQLIENPKQTKVALQLNDMVLQMQEAYIFAPDLAQNATVAVFGEEVLSGRIDLEASQAAVTLRHTELHWGDQTHITLDGEILNPLDSNLLSFDMQTVKLRTRRADVDRLLGAQASGIQYPDSIRVTAAVVGDLSQVKVNTAVNTTDGDVRLDGRFSKNKMMSFDADLAVDQLAMGKWLQNPALGEMSFTATAKGKGNDLQSLNADLKTHFTAFQIKEKDYSDLTLKGEMKNGKAMVDLIIDDENIKLALNGQLHLIEERKEIQLALDLKGIDLYALGLTQDDIRARMKLELSAVLDSADSRLHAVISEGQVVYDKEPYSLGAFSVDGLRDEDSTKLEISSQVLNAKLLSNAAPEVMIAAIERHLSSYLEDTTERNMDSPVGMTLDMTITETPMLLEVVLADLEELDPVNLHVDFSEEKRLLDLQFSAPYTQYNGTVVDSLEMHVHADSAQLAFDMGWYEIAMDPVLIERTRLSGTVAEDQLVFDLDAYRGEDVLVHVQSDVHSIGDTIVYHMRPEGLVLNGQSWQVDPDNEIKLAQSFVNFSDFVLSYQQQRVELDCGFAQVDEPHIGLRLANFSIGSVTSYLSGGEPLADGVMGGDVVLANPFADKALLADLTVKNLQAMGAQLGTLTLYGESKTAKNYDFDLGLKGEYIDLGLKGDYHASADRAAMNLDLDLRQFQADLLDSLSGGQLSGASGVITGKAKVSGTTLKPEYKGNLAFDQVGFRVDALDAKFMLAEEQISFDTKQVILNQFTVLDEKQNSIEIDGLINTVDRLNPKFDIRLRAKNFHALNSDKSDQELFYGKVNLDADMKVGGDLKIPIIRGKININEGTNLTVVIPESEVEVKERDGVVLFVNKQNPDDILTRGNEEELSAMTLKGYDVNATVSINEKSTFKIVVNENTNDNLEISGKGDFNLGLEPNGRTSFNGRYEISKGHYKASLYNLVTKEFDIASGSRIVWKGDPLDADVDVRAIYKVTTSAAPLMANKTSGLTSDAASIYNRRLPFLVYLNVKDQLLKPQISFELDMKPEDQSTLGGEVYGQIKQLNEQEEELNKQVFSLLVLDRFFPQAGSDGSSGGTAAIARDNVSKVLSSQLNQVSDKVTGNSGLELNFNVDSYTYDQGEGAETRTQLGIDARKKFADDRVIVKVGSDVNIQGKEQEGQGSPLIGDASVEYLLTKNGRYRVKGFGKDEFDTVIDGQYFVTGIAFIYNREFNEFSDLWKKAAKEAGIDLDSKKQKSSKKEEQQTKTDKKK